MSATLDYLVALAIRLGHWGYLIISVGAMLESAAFLGLFVPGESLVVIAGFLAGQGVFDLDVLIIAVVIGAILGDNLGYEFGRRLGRPWAARYGGRVGVSEARLKRAEEFFSRHGGKAVFLGRFVGFARALVPFIAGSARMSYVAFLCYNALGAALWGATFTLLGYFLGHTAQKWVGKATALLGGIALFALILVWLWRQIAGHERQIKERWERLKRRPRIAALLTRFAPQLAWLKDRLSPGSYFGLELTAGVLLFLGTAWLFGGIAQDVVAGDPLTILDRKIDSWFHRHQDSQMTAFMATVSWLHTWPITLVIIVFLVYLAWRRSWRWLIVVICTVGGGMLLNSLLKLAFHRERPSLSGLAAALTTYSFPSGHTVAATLIYAAISTYLASRVIVWRWRILIVLAAVFLVAVVALSRMYLGVHYLSDVLAAFAEGLAWFALCHIAVTTLWTHQLHRPLGRKPC